MSQRVTKRPCSIPSIQIDTWGKRKPEHVGLSSESALARSVMQDYPYIAVYSLLRNARTIREFADAVDCIYQPLQVTIQSGQLYLSKLWRIRYKDMPTSIQEMVIALQGSHDDLQQEFERYYTASVLEHMLYRVIGPSRTEAVQCLRRCLPSPHAGRTV